MPSGDVFLLLQFFKERDARQKNEIDLGEVDPDQLSKMMGAT